MQISEQINAYISGLSESKGRDLQTLHHAILKVKPDCRLWFLDGKNSEGKVVSNPNIGYGQVQLEYKDGSVKEFYRFGISANTSGISIYVFGIKDKSYLKEHFGTRLGKASVSGYCIKFKELKDLHAATLDELIRFGLQST